MVLRHDCDVSVLGWWFLRRNMGYEFPSLSLLTFSGNPSPSESSVDGNSYAVLPV